MITVEVDADALRQVLTALCGPGYLIRELQSTRRIGNLVKEPNPIDTLIMQYNSQVTANAKGGYL